MVYASLGGIDESTLEINAQLSELTDVVDWVRGYPGSVVLRRDGTVVCLLDSESEMSRALAKWENIVDIDDRGYGVLGICADGTVNVAEHSWEGEEYFGKVEGLTDIVGLNLYTALRSDGTVCFFRLDDMQNSYIDATYNRWKDSINSWDDIVALCNDGNVYDNGNLYGLKADGTVVAAGRGYKAETARKWTDIVRIIQTYDGVMGIKKDGTVVMNGEQNTGARNWTNMEVQ